MRYLVLITVVLALTGTTLSLADGPRMPGKTDRCPVCGMFVAPYPDWVATIQFEDGSQLFFDGAKDLMKHYFTMPTKHDPRTRETIGTIYFTDYYTTRLLPAADLFFVLGSDVYGPMGHELIPIAGKEAAESFARDHGGKQILRFDQITLETVPAD